jgi:hypothetical protein
VRNLGIDAGQDISIDQKQQPQCADRDELPRSRLERYES